MPAHYSGGYLSAGIVLSDISGTPEKFAEYQSLRQGARPIGQFGSLYNSIRNTNNDHTAWAAVNVLASETITGYGQIVLTKSAASFRGPALDSTKVSAIPPGFDYAAISDLGRYSSLDMRWWNLEAGVHHTLRKQFLIDYALTYQDYKDNQPYLVNTTGKSLGFLLRANWIF